MSVEELVVLVDEDGRAIGTAPKAQVHHGATPLHLAFSCYLYWGEDVLVTRRALTKATFPGVWTNSVCGHPGPGEPIESAVTRRARDELGVEVTRIQLVLPRFRYWAEAGGVVENELCPVFAGWVADASTTLAPAEVDAAHWEPWCPFRDDVVSGVREVSRWCAEQVRELTALGDHPGQWPTADPALLPHAIRRTPRDTRPSSGTGLRAGREPPGRSTASA
ncbi:MAG TPA: isopentenyl-diphosphate Delta-isomerase [Candidatus Lustribacter sp.]|nr:isopentenyl-diphosphate Delta-isomerase [Candidatus Lustribacter sp.]